MDYSNQSQISYRSHSQPGYQSGADEDLQRSPVRNPFVTVAVDGQDFTDCSDFYTVSELKARGWTRRLVSVFLGEADSTAQNPHFKSGRPMKFYKRQRVHQSEVLDDFGVQIGANAQRRQSIQRVIEGKTHALVELASAVDCNLPDWDMQELDAQASELFGFAIDETSAHRAQLSALVKHASSCEWVLDDYFWHPGIRSARMVIRRKVLAKIIQSYPHLADVALEWSKKEQGNAQIDVFLA